MKTKLIASLAVAASLLLSGCVTRYVPVAAPVTAPAKAIVTNVAVCPFMAYSKGKTYSGAVVSLVSYSDDTQYVKFPNGEHKQVYRKMYSNDGKHLMHLVRDTADDGTLIIGSAYDCR